MSSRPPSRRALAALLLVGLACVPAVACSGDDEQGTTSTTVGLSVPELDYPTFSDATQPVAVPKGRRFAIMLPADPANGWRWVVTSFDRDLLAPLGSEFDEDPERLAQATTTTTPPPPPPPESTTPEPGSTGTDEETTPTTADPATTTTVPGPLVQVISFAGKAKDVTTITLRYQRVGADPSDPGDDLEFVVLIDGATPPEPTSPETGLPPP